MTGAQCWTTKSWQGIPTPKGNSCKYLDFFSFLIPPHGDIPSELWMI